MIVMKKIIKNISLALLCLISFSLTELQASHVVGGSLSYRCLGNGTFEVLLEFRRDCFNGDPLAQFDDPVSIGIFDSNNNLVTSVGNAGELLIPFNNDDTLNEILTSECRVLGEDVCVQITEYRRTIELPFREGGYTLAYQRCCRNGTLNNIIDPTFQGATYVAQISEDNWTTCNSSARFRAWPSVFLCANQEINFDHSAVDVDGDSLVYSLCTPLIGASAANPQPSPPSPPPYGNVIFENGFGLDNLLGGDPLAIDPNTGLLTGIPNATGQFVVGVCVDEYRNGLLINRTIRDFQYNVRICLENPDAEIATDVDLNCDGLEINFTDASGEHDEQIWFFDFPNNTLSAEGEQVSFTFPESGTYDVALFISDDECVDSTFATVQVSNPDDTQANFETSFVDCLDDLEVTITSDFSSVIPIVSQSWTIVGPNTDLSITGPLEMIDLPESGTYTFTWTLENEFGCITEVSRDIEFQLLDDDPVGSFTTSFLDCLADLTIFFDTDIQSEFEIINQTWTVVGPQTDLMINGPLDSLAVPGGSGSYTITLFLENELGCTFEITQVEDFLLTPIDFELEVDQIRVCSLEPIVLNPNPDPNLTYLWTSIPPGLIDDPTDPSPEVILTEEAQFVVTAFLGNCSGSDSLIVTPQSVDIEILETIEDQYFYCEGESLTVEIEADGFEDITWIGGDGNILGMGSPFTFIPDGPQTLTIIGADNLMCADTTQVFIEPHLYNGEIIGDDLICLDEQVTLNIVNDEDPLQVFEYAWEPSQNTIGPASGTEVVFQNDESFDVFVTVSNQFGCEFLIDYFVEVDQFSNVDAVAEPDDILLEESTQLNVTLIEGATYQWSPSGTLDDPNIPNPIATPDDDGIVYTVTVTNENGCIAIDTVSVRVMLPLCDENDVFVPNMFTPNGDNFNDIFRPESNFIDEMQMIVYNRWGEEVFSTTDPDGGWDGTFEGEELEPDTYGYHLSVLCINGETFVMQGNVTIIK